MKGIAKTVIAVSGLFFIVVGLSTPGFGMGSGEVQQKMRQRQGEQRPPVVQAQRKVQEFKTVAQVVLSRLHVANELEMKAIALIKDRTENKRILQFLDTIESEHAALDEKLVKIAKDRNIELTDCEDLRKEFIEAKAKLEQLKGAELDRAFLVRAIACHRDMAAKIATLQERIRDRVVCEFVENVVDRIKAHQGAAEELLAAIGGTEGGTGDTEND